MFESFAHQETPIIRMAVKRETYEKMRSVGAKYGIRVLSLAGEGEKYTATMELHPGDDPEHWDKVDMLEDGTMIGINNDLVVKPGYVFVAIESPKTDLSDFWNDVKGK